MKCTACLWRRQTVPVDKTPSQQYKLDMDSCQRLFTLGVLSEFVLFKLRKDVGMKKEITENSKSVNSKNKPYHGLDLQERKDVRRKMLIEAGLELFGTSGYRNSSVKNVCDYLELTERYFYESFSNRESLLIAVFESQARELDERLRRISDDPALNSQERLKKVLAEFFSFVRKDPRRGRILMFEVLGVSATVDQAYQAAVRNLAALLENPCLGLFRSGNRQSGRARRVLSIGLVGAITQIAIQWMLDNFATPESVVVKKSLEIYQAVADAERNGSKKNPTQGRA